MKWSELNNQQVGTYAEYYFKMEFTKYGLSVFSAEVDDRGVDLVIRSESGGVINHYDVQIKSIRHNTSYIFIPESKFRLSAQLLVGVAIFPNDKDLPELFLIPATAWNELNALLNYKDYESRGLKSKNEYGINLSKKNRPLMEPYRFENIIESL